MDGRLLAAFLTAVSLSRINTEDIRKVWFRSLTHTPVAMVALLRPRVDLPILYLLLAAFVALCSTPCLAQDLATKQDIFRADGSAQLRFSAYRSNRRAFPSNAVYLTVAPTFHLYGVAVPLQLTLSNVGVDFRQPFNRFSIAPRYKWAEVQLGWIQPRYSEFTMANYTMLGAGVTLEPGKWDLSLSYGRLNRATTLDTLAGTLNPESFDRFGHALRIGYGTERANVYATYLSAQDDVSSIKFAEPIGRRELLDVEPAANTATSFGFEVPFGKTLSLSAEAALSVFTENHNLDDSDIDSSLLNQGIPDLLVDAFNLNASSDYYTAVNSRLEYKGGGPLALSAFLGYRRIDPNYRTMGSYFFQNDLEHFLVGAAFKPWKQLRLQGSVGRQRDNLNNIKAATSKRIIGTARATLQLQQFAASLDFFNYSNDQTPRLARIGDSLRIASTNQSLSLSPSYTLQRDKYVHVVAATLSRSTVRDFIGGQSEGAAFRDFNTDLLTATYSITVLATSTTVGLTGTYTSLGNSGDDLGAPGGFASQGLNLSITQGFAASKGSVGVNGGLYGQSTAAEEDSLGTVKTVGLNAGYRASKRFGLHASFQYSGGPATGRLANTASTFSDIRIDTRLTYRL